MTGATCVETLWRFIRGDISPAEFDAWVCTEPEAERALGPQLHLRAISASYGDPYQVDLVKSEIERFLRESVPARCACLEMRDLQVVPMGHHEPRFRTLVEVRRHGDPLWWLDIERCAE